MGNVQKEKIFNILLVDDDAVDRELFIDAISLARKNTQVFEAANGEEALLYLTNCTQIPDLIFLDLNMPVKDGRETLKEIRQTEGLKSIPVCILSTSNAHFEVANAYNAGANLFLVKPFDFKDLQEMLSSILAIFSTFALLPERGMSR